MTDTVFSEATNPDPASVRKMATELSLALTEDDLMEVAANIALLASHWARVRSALDARKYGAGDD